MSNESVNQQLEKEIEKARQEMGKRPNILICGYTGSGKSSLTKAILGDIVPDNAIGHGAPKTMGFDCFENDLNKVEKELNIEKKSLSNKEKTKLEKKRKTKCSRQLNLGTIKQLC